MIDAATLAAEFAALPDPVKVALGYALKPMVGDLKAIPTFIAKRVMRQSEVGTVARLEAAKELGKLVAAEAMTDPEYVEATKQALLPTEIARIANRAGVAAEAILAASAEHTREAAKEPDTNSATESRNPETPDDDWMMAFMRHAEDASSTELRSLFGRILSGQISRPGSFTRATLRAVADMDQAIANDFIWFWGHCIGDGAPSTMLSGPGIEWARLSRLRDAGLVSYVESGIWQPNVEPMEGLGYPWRLGFDDVGLLLFFKDYSRRHINIFGLTSTGKQISQIVDHPDKKAALMKLATSYMNEDVNRVDLFEAGKQTQMLWINQPTTV